MEWFVALVQFEQLELNSSGKTIGEGYAWDIAFVQAKDEQEAAKLIKDNPKCFFKAFSIGKRTEVLVHRVENLDEAMERKDATPKRTRRKK